MSLGIKCFYLCPHWRGQHECEHEGSPIQDYADGGTKFTDELIRAGDSGGQQAGQALRNAAIEHARKDIGIHYDFDVLIYVYINFKGLAKTYVDTCKILPSWDILARFIQGFNMSHGLVNMIDACPGKECSDAKIKGWSLYLLISRTTDAS